MVDEIVRSKRGRPSESVKRLPEWLLDLCHHIDVRKAESRQIERKLSVKKVCEQIQMQGGWHEFIGCPPDHRAKCLEGEVQFGSLNDARTGIRNNTNGDILLRGSIQNADSLRRRFCAGKKYIRDNGLKEMMDSRLRDAFGEPRQSTGWAIGWRPPFAFQLGYNLLRNAV